MTTQTGESNELGARRDFVRVAASSAVGLALGACARGAAPGTTTAASPPAAAGEQEAEVTPGEDLMQEHGVLRRILLIYHEVASRLERGEAPDLAVVTESAAIVRRFIEDYHEQLEEDFLFPRFEAAQTQIELVTVLREQHRRGREATDAIRELAAAGAEADPRRLAELLRAFERMYGPHAAREDTVLFPAFREVVGREGYRELGEQFEAREHALFGEHGFAETVARVAGLKQALGLDDLASFTLTLPAS